MAFNLLQNGKWFLASLDIESGKKDPLREEGHGWEFPRLSRDETQMAFNSREGGTINVWTARVEGGPAKQLTFDKELMGWPCWSPDGDKIVFAGLREGVWNFW